MADEQVFREPQLAINRIYTRGGDKGQTALVGGQRVGKDDPRIECYGTVDELNSHIGLASVLAGAQSATRDLETILTRVQNELFNLGSILATLPEDVGPQQPRVTEAEVKQLEREIDGMNEGLPALRSFVLPGGSMLCAQLHVCRTVCRRAERLLVAFGRTNAVPDQSVQYLNRLSDALFVWSRWANMRLESAEVLWQPNRSASGVSKPE